MTKSPQSLFFAPICCAAVIGATLALCAHAAVTPTLVLNNLGNNQVQVTVTGDPNQPISLYYYTQYPTLATNAGTIGYTASNEYFSTNLLSGQYNIPSNAYVYVMVDGAVSSPIEWPYNSTIYSSTNQVTFSQNNISIAPNQTMQIIVYGGSGAYYVSQNSSLVSAALNGDTLTLSGNENESGSGSLVICSSSSSCGTLYLNITAPTYTYQYPTAYQTLTPISLSQSAISLRAGQQEYINIYGNGSYYLYSNSNQYSVTSGISGSTLWINGLEPGISYVVVCGSLGSSCATLYVDVGAPLAYTAPPAYYSEPQQIYYPQPVIQQGFRPITYMFQPVARYLSYLYPRNW